MAVGVSGWGGGLGRFAELPLHSFGNKLLFWPRRLLWARAAAALAGKSWVGGGAALAGEAAGTAGARETDRRRPSAPQPQPLLLTPSPEVGAPRSLLGSSPSIA
jgi:hypothetical protein